MKTILVIAFSDLAMDSRVHRQIRFLSERYRIIASGWKDPCVENVDFIPLPKVTPAHMIALSPLLLLRQFERYYWRQAAIVECLKRLSRIRVHLILANDIETLPLALKLAQGAKVILDAHEYAPGQVEDMWFWRLFFQKYKTYLCTAYIPKVDGMMTVSQGLAEMYERDTGVRPIVVTNAPDFEQIEPHWLDDRESPIRLVHHGKVSPSRRTENLIRMMELLDDRFRLDLILMEAWPGYIKRLQQLARRNERIRFLPPVSMKRVSQHLNQYDIGVHFLKPVNFNFLHSLPNKLFEFVQARLAVAIGPSPEMVRIVKHFDLGVVAQDFSPEAMARCLIALDAERINYYKSQSNRAARALSALENRATLLGLAEKVLGS